MHLCLDLRQVFLYGPEFFLADGDSFGGVTDDFVHIGEGAVCFIQNGLDAVEGRVGLIQPFRILG